MKVLGGHVHIDSIISLVLLSLLVLLLWIYCDNTELQLRDKIYLFSEKLLNCGPFISRTEEALDFRFFLNEILNDFSSDRSWFLRNQWYSFSIKRVYFSTFILQQKYLDFLPLLKRYFRTFWSRTAEPFKVLGWNIDRSLEKSILSLWMSFCWHI